VFFSPLACSAKAFPILSAVDFVFFFFFSFAAFQEKKNEGHVVDIPFFLHVRLCLALSSSHD
jgi:hypothetical protein